MDELISELDNIFIEKMLINIIFDYWFDPIDYIVRIYTNSVISKVFNSFDKFEENIIITEPVKLDHVGGLAEYINIQVINYKDEIIHYIKNNKLFIMKLLLRHFIMFRNTATYKYFIDEIIKYINDVLDEIIVFDITHFRNMIVLCNNVIVLDQQSDSNVTVSDIWILSLI